ncbi:MAG: hypothetical protein K2F59_01755 [Eubacteriales bacterium]|nr:hypothetical protein [Eubacteriales bacterium]
MDTFNLVFMFIMVIGFSIIIFSLIKLNKEDKATPLSSFEKSLSEVKDALGQADIAIDDLNFISEEMFKQFEEKKKELMFLYDAIEKKKGSEFNIDISAPKFSYLEEEKNLEIKNKNTINHPMLPKIKELMDKNYSLPEIAKALNIGQGELKFIIELGME